MLPSSTRPSAGKASPPLILAETPVTRPSSVHWTTQMLSLVVTHTRLSGGDPGAASSSSMLERQSAATGLSVCRNEAGSSCTSLPFPLGCLPCVSCRVSTGVPCVCRVCVVCVEERRGPTYSDEKSADALGGAHPEMGAADGKHAVDPLPVLFVLLVVLGLLGLRLLRWSNRVLAHD